MELSNVYDELKQKQLTFDTKEAMYEVLDAGVDLYNIDTEDYLMLYSSDGDIAHFSRIDFREACECSEAHREYEEYWSENVSCLGTIYEVDKEDENTTSALEYCEDMYAVGIWVTTIDFENVVMEEK